MRKTRLTRRSLRRSRKSQWVDSSWAAIWIRNLWRKKVSQSSLSNPNTMALLRTAWRRWFRSSAIASSRIKFHVPICVSIRRRCRLTLIPTMLQICTRCTHQWPPMRTIATWREAKIKTKQRNLFERCLRRSKKIHLMRMFRRAEPSSEALMMLVTQKAHQSRLCLKRSLSRRTKQFLPSR